jgi:hypothetical protein
MDKTDKLILVHTNLVIPFTSLPAFFLDNSKVVKQLDELIKGDVPTLKAYLLMAKPLSANFETITAWKSTKDLANFYMFGTLY